MSASQVVGPYRTLSTVEGGAFPYYIIPFDKDGNCEGPQTREHLLNAAAGYTDIFLFSHGWNNDWKTATGRYESFINGFQHLRSELGLPMPADYKPLLVGIFWPSQALEWFEHEKGPDFAASSPEQQDEAAQLEVEILRDVAAALPAPQRSRFHELAHADRLDPAQAQELAGMLAAVCTPDDEGVRADALSARDLLAAAISFESPEPDYDAIGSAGGVDSGTPMTAGLADIMSSLDPRNIIKPFTLWQMKDRSGKVGALGVAPLLGMLLSRSQARIHLLGHSFGCKVVMTAASVPPCLARKVESALLLQAAVSQYAFASDVPGRHVPGGFFRALERVCRPILSTYSAHDSALTKMFHLALRREDDLGELQYAASGSPSRYAALGGFGPQGSGAVTVDILDPGASYDLSGSGRIMGVNGTRTISSHGDVSNRSTWWLAYQLATAHQCLS